jgi:hypothetical protein
MVPGAPLQVGSSKHRDDGVRRSDQRIGGRRADLASFQPGLNRADERIELIDRLLVCSLLNRGKRVRKLVGQTIDLSAGECQGRVGKLTDKDLNGDIHGVQAETMESARVDPPCCGDLTQVVNSRRLSKRDCCGSNQIVQIVHCAARVDEGMYIDASERSSYDVAILIDAKCVAEWTRTAQAAETVRRELDILARHGPIAMLS